ncbi:MAG TPA: hypothetical protein VNQ90_20190 [Chthoniobacteraceae bacterium]|nr:hypothetical protein [Chthoniobacteraceae bacterium]
MPSSPLSQRPRRLWRTGSFIALLFGLVAALWTTRLAASGVPVFSAAFTEKPPALDGTLDETWSEAPLYADFLRIDAPQSSVHTTVRLLFDRENLYLFFQGEEPDTGHLKIEQRPDGNGIWEDDSVDLLLVTDPFAPAVVGYHLIGNLNGDAYSETITFPKVVDKTWHPAWKRGAKVGKGEWSFAAAVPWKEIAMDGAAPGKRLEGKFGRVRRAALEEGEYYSLGGARGFQNLEGRVVIHLAEAAVSVTDAGWEEDPVKKQVTVRATLKGGAAPVKARLQWSDAAHGEGEPVSLSAGQSREVTLTRQLTAGDQHQPLQWQLTADGADTLLYASGPYSLRERQEFLTIEPLELYYYPQETIALRIVSPTAEEVTVSVRRRSTGKEHFRRQVRIGQANAPAYCLLNPTMLPGVGEYEAIVTSGDGAAVATAGAFFGVVRKAQWPGIDVRKAEVRKDGQLYVNGKPYFTCMMFHASIQEYARIAYYGFNSVHGDNTTTPPTPGHGDSIPEQLEAARQHGLLVNANLSDRGHGTTLGKREHVEAKLRAIKDHPALLMYHLVDEPRVHTYPRLLTAYQAVKKIAPDRPLYCTLPNFLNYPESIMDDAARHRDIISPDLYPFDNHPVMSVAHGVRKCVETAARSEAPRMVIYTGPTFHWLPTYRMPRPEEVRLVAYLAIINGARGLDWYSWAEVTLEARNHAYGLHAPQATLLRSYFKRLNREFSVLAAAIGSPKPAGELQIEAPRELSSALYADEETLYAVVANPHPQEVNAAIALKDTGVPEGKKIAVFHEDREVPFHEGRFQDGFAPNEVHVYAFPRK